MNQTAIFWPMMVQVLLIYIVYALMARRRGVAVRAGSVNVSQFKGRGNEPTQSETASNNLMNQFELPVLFFILCLALYVTNGVNFITLALMWLFVILRYAHAAVHLTSNRLSLRFRFFSAGLILLGIGWLWFALHVAGAV